MPRRIREFINDEIYHITLKRIGDDLLFKDLNDYYRGIFSIYEFNTTDLITIRQRRKIRTRIKKASKTDSVPTPVTDSRNLLVDIFCFCFMPNHIHLLLRQIRNGGISKFIQKFGAGYSLYFKQKHNIKQKGHFFQNRFVAVPITNDDQLKTVFVYVHTNPISLIEPKWKEIGIKNPEKAIEFVENYKWSSYLDYLGKKNFPSVTEREFMLNVMDNEQGCKRFVDDWLHYKGKTRDFPELSLEE